MIMNVKTPQAMMNGMSGSVTMMMEKIAIRVCKHQDRSTMTPCMTDPTTVDKMGGLFCGMEGKMMPCQHPTMENMTCMCPSCLIASDMGRAMTTPCTERNNTASIICVASHLFFAHLSSLKYCIY